MKNIFVTGDGFISRAFLKAGYQALSCDVTNVEETKREIERAKPEKPEIVINLNETPPDYCEFHFEKAFASIVKGTQTVVGVCRANKIPVVTISSSQIWGGGRTESLWNKHSENSKLTCPANNYGLLHIGAETIANMLNFDGYNYSKIVRTSEVFNREEMNGELLCLREGVKICAPKSVKHSFLHVDHFVELMGEYCKFFYTMPTVLHLAGSKTVSCYDFWLEVCKQFGFDKKLLKSQDNSNVRLPRNGGLDTSLSKTLGFYNFDYIDGIARMKDES